MDVPGWAAAYVISLFLETRLKAQPVLLIRRKAVRAAVSSLARFFFIDQYLTLPAAFCCIIAGERSVFSRIR